MQCIRESPPSPIYQDKVSNQLLTEIAVAGLSSLTQSRPRRSKRPFKKPNWLGYEKSIIPREPLSYKATMCCSDSDKWQDAIMAEHQSI